MHVLNVNSFADLQTGGGTAERTIQMSRNLAKAGVECTVLTLDIGNPAQRINILKPASLVVLSCLWQRFQVPWMKWRMVRRLVQEADVIHLMGHWSVLNAFVYLLARKEGKPYVVCPAGALPLFGRSALLKKTYNLLIGKSIIVNASAWIAVTAMELPHFEAYGVPASRVTVIPNGVNQEDFPVTETDGYLQKHGLSGIPFILFMGRLNPIKGPDLLLAAFVSVKDRLPGFHLVFAGPDEGLLAMLRKLAETGGISDRVHFLGYAHGQDKATLYRTATLLVVPSRQEAMSIVALEAGICGTPAMLTDQCGFGEVRTVDRRLEVPASAQGIAGGLVALLESPDTVEQIKPGWFRFVEQNYSWPFLVPQFIKLYDAILIAN